MKKQLLDKQVLEVVEVIGKLSEELNDAISFMQTLEEFAEPSELTREGAWVRINDKYEALEKAAKLLEELTETEEQETESTIDPHELLSTRPMY